MRISNIKLYTILVIILSLLLIATVVILFDRRVHGLENAQTPTNNLNK